MLTPIEQLRLKLQYLLCPECFARIPASHKRSDFGEGTGAQHAVPSLVLRAPDRPELFHHLDKVCRCNT